MATETRDERIARLVHERELLSDQQAALKAQQDERDEELLALIQKGTPWEGDYEGRHYRVIKTNSTKTLFDEVGFARSLKQSQWNAVSRRVIDQDKLAIALRDSKITPEQVDKFKTVEDNKPYIKITARHA